MALQVDIFSTCKKMLKFIHNVYSLIQNPNNVKWETHEQLLPSTFYEKGMEGIKKLLSNNS